MMTSLPPFAIFFIAALIVPFLKGWARNGFLLAVPVLSAVNMFGFEYGTYFPAGFFDHTLTLVRVDKLSLLFGTIFHLAAFIGVLYSLHLTDNDHESVGGHPLVEGRATIQHVSGLLYVGSTMGVVFGGDLITVFIFWELMAVTPVFLILARGTERARHSAMRYMIIQIISGVILLAGIVARFHETGDLSFNNIGLGGLSGTLILLAFGIKACFPLLHNWAPDAYGEATPTGSVLLCTFTTKTAIYMLARGYAGTEMLVYIGGIMTMFPIFYAVIENDLRRVLSYSLVNQLGFMVCGIGIGTELALNGAVAHAFAHILYKALLFMSMGSVLTMTGKINGSELGGLYKTMPKTTVLCIIGAASISAFPLFSGFVTKSMTMAAAVQEGYHYVWLALLFASAGVFHHSGIKIPFFAFFAHDSGIRAKEPPMNMLLAMSIAAFFCIFIGCLPLFLYDLLPYAVSYAPYTAPHVVTQMQLLLFSALAFTLLKLTGIYPPELPSVNLDAEWAYRRALPRATGWLLNVFAPVDRRLRQAFLAQTQRLIGMIFRHHGPEGVMARATHAGNMVTWVILLLVVFLVLNFI